MHLVLLGFLLRAVGNYCIRLKCVPDFSAVHLLRFTAIRRHCETYIFINQDKRLIKKIIPTNTLVIAHLLGN